MLNWLLVPGNEMKELNNVEEIQQAGEELNKIETGIFPRELIEEIINFDKDILIKVGEPGRYYFYNLLDEIRKRIDLTHVKIKEPVSFLSKLEYTLQVLIVSKRLKIYGKDNGFSYTDQEYINAYKQLKSIESRDKYRLPFNVGFGLFIVSGIGLLFDTNYFLSGVYLTNILLYGSFILSSVLN